MTVHFFYLKILRYTFTEVSQMTPLMSVILMFTSCAGRLCFTGLRWGPPANRHQQQGKGDEPNPSITLTKSGTGLRQGGVVAVRLVSCLNPPRAPHPSSCRSGGRHRHPSIHEVRPTPHTVGARVACLTLHLPARGSAPRPWRGGRRPPWPLALR